MKEGTKARKTINDEKRGHQSTMDKENILNTYSFHTTYIPGT